MSPRDILRIFAILWVFVLTSGNFYPVYEITKTKSVRLTHQDFFRGKVSRNKRVAPVAAAAATGAAGAATGTAGAATGTAGAAGAAGAAGGWTGQIAGAASAAQGWLSVAGTAIQAGVQIAGVIAQFEEIGLKREQMKIQERQFQEEMALKTAQLCATICVTPWSPWQACSARCGGGSTSRKRQRYESDTCKGKPCPFHLEETGVCNEGCANNGWAVGGKCDCPRGFIGDCCNNEIICDYPGKPRNGDVHGTIPAKFGGVITYTCSEGFALQGDEARVCRANSQWDGSQPTCSRLTCAEPPEPRNGQNLNKQPVYQYGQEAVFRCHSGYVLTGPEKRQCVSINDGSTAVWSAFTPLCLPVNCYDPGYPLNGYANGSEFTLGNTVTFSCRTGFRMVGSERRTCRENGKWSGHEVTCQLIECEAPLIPHHASLRRPREHYRYGISIAYECEDGFLLEGDESAVCEADPELTHIGTGGRWSKEPPTCKPVTCGDPGQLENGAKDGSIYYYPNNVTFVCFDGYILQGAATIHCSIRGVWTAPPPTCIGCPVNTYKGRSDKSEECIPCPDNTHTITAASTSVKQCVCNLGWTGPSGGPCTEITCPQLQIPGHGKMTCTSNKYNGQCDITCDEGHILDRGSSRRTCQDTGDWTGTDAKCTACPVNTFKSDEKSCLPCPLHSHTLAEASKKNQCVCDQGYEGPAGGPCSDSNECSINGGRGPCSDVCRNTDGSYVCECSIPGYVIDTAVDIHNCKLEKSCRNLTITDAPGNGGLVCHWYYEENSQQCSIKCNPGYEFPSRTNNYETCGPTTGYKWSYEERGEVIEPCIEEFFPEFRIEGNSSYFVRNCDELTPDEVKVVQEDFAQMLTDQGVCIRRQSKVCDAKNVGIICGARSRRRRRGVEEEVSQVGLSFELSAIKVQDNPKNCADICRMLNIPPARCSALCVPTYKRFLTALMTYTKKSVEDLFSKSNTASFQSGSREFEYVPGTLATSDVIVDCPTGMKIETEATGIKGNCVPCIAGTYYSEEQKECIKCPIHTYQANYQQTTCLPCPRGSYAPKTGSAACSPCPEKRWGDKCTGSCSCEHGFCDSTNGKCVCHSGWEGKQCNIDIQSCTAESCYPGVRCQDIPAPGTGYKCAPCPAGMQGDGTICEYVPTRRGTRSLHHSRVIGSALSGLSLGLDTL